MLPATAFDMIAVNCTKQGVGEVKSTYCMTLFWFRGAVCSRGKERAENRRVFSNHNYSSLYFPLPSSKELKKSGNQFQKLRC